MDALSAIRSAERLDPRSLSVRSAAAMVVFFDEKFEDGLINVEKALEIDPKFVPALKVKRWILTAKNDHAGAHAVVEPERLFSGGSKSDPSWDIIEAQVADPVEQRAEALAMLARAANADTIRSNDKAFAFDIALAFNHLGESSVPWIILNGLKRPAPTVSI